MGFVISIKAVPTFGIMKDIMDLFFNNISLFIFFFCFVFFSYFSQLSDNGQKLGEEVRSSYHQLVLMLVGAVQGFSNLNEK